MNTALTATDLPHNTGLVSRIMRRLESAIRAVQYSRMIHALSDLSDDQLASLGLTRADIPRYAHECVHDTSA